MGNVASKNLPRYAAETVGAAVVLAGVTRYLRHHIDEEPRRRANKDAAAVSAAASSGGDGALKRSPSTARLDRAAELGRSTPISLRIVLKVRVRGWSSVRRHKAHAALPNHPLRSFAFPLLPPAVCLPACHRAGSRLLPCLPAALLIC